VVPLVGKKLCLHPEPPFALDEIRLGQRQSQVAVALRSGWRIDELALGTGMPFEEITRLLYALAVLGVVITSDHPAARMALRAVRQSQPPAPGAGGTTGQGEAAGDAQAASGGAAGPPPGAGAGALGAQAAAAVAGLQAGAPAPAPDIGAPAPVPNLGAPAPGAQTRANQLTPGIGAAAPAPGSGVPAVAGGGGAREPAPGLGAQGTAPAALPTAGTGSWPAAPQAAAPAPLAWSAAALFGDAPTAPGAPGTASLAAAAAPTAEADAAPGGASVGQVRSATRPVRAVAAEPSVSERRRNEIMQIYLSYRRLDSFDLLGADEEASPAEVEGRYLEMAQRFAPWTLAGPDLAGMEEKARDIFLAGARA